MRHAVKQLDFPFGGVDRSRSPRENTLVWGRGYYTTESALNVFGMCPFEGRMRGGSRPCTRRIGQAAASVWEWENSGVIEREDGTGYELLDSDIHVGDEYTIVRNDHPESIRCSVGQAPSSVSVTARYRSRLIAASGHILYMSRQGADDDWDYSGDGGDVGQALAMSLDSAGGSAEDITAVVPIRDRYAYLATRSSLWILEGDPVDGRLTLISGSVGILCRSAFAVDGTRLFFVSDDGVYLAEANDLKRWSRERLPDELVNLGGSEFTPHAGYDPSIRSYFLFLEGAQTHYAFDSRREAVWPFSLPAGQEPVGIGRVISNAGIPLMGMLGTDGVWRVFDSSGPTDDGGHVVQSNVRIGPFRIAGDFLDGFLSELSCTISMESCPVELSIWTDHDCEVCAHKADSEPPAFRYIVRPGWNRVIRPRIRGEWACIKLSASSRWAYEHMSAKIVTTGG